MVDISYRIGSLNRLDHLFTVKNFRAGSPRSPEPSDGMFGSGCFIAVRDHKALMFYSLPNNSCPFIPGVFRNPPKPEPLLQATRLGGRANCPFAPAGTFLQTNARVVDLGMRALLIFLVCIASVGTAHGVGTSFRKHSLANRRPRGFERPIITL